MTTEELHTSKTVGRMQLPSFQMYTNKEKTKATSSILCSFKIPVKIPRDEYNF